MKKKTLYIFGGIFAILLITNPSPKSFEEYARGVGDSDYILIKNSRKYNFFVASIYQVKYITRFHDEYYYDMQCFGIAGNFFPLKN